MNKVILSLVAVLALTGCLEKEQEYVAVVGIGEARAFPDYASVMVSIKGEGDTSAQATEAMSATVNNVRNAAAELGITDEGFDTLFFELDRETVRRALPEGGTERVPGDYIATQYLRVRTDDVYKAGDLMAAMINTGAESVDNPQYLINDEASLFINARDLAIEDALRRAKQYASKSGKKLGEMLIIEESGTEAERLRFQLRDRLVRSYDQEESGGGASLLDMSAGYGPGAASIFARPQEISVSISIYVKFELDNAPASSG